MLRMEDRNHWTDERVELVVGNLLRSGVALAATVGLIGGILYLFRHGGGTPEYHVFHGEPAALTSIVDVLRGALHLRGESVIQLGILLLIATPVARVALSLATFALQRDWVYVLITATVLGLLLYGLLAS